MQHDTELNRSVDRDLANVAVAHRVHQVKVHGIATGEVELPHPTKRHARQLNGCRCRPDHEHRVPTDPQRLGLLVALHHDVVRQEPHLSTHIDGHIACAAYRTHLGKLQRSCDRHRRSVDRRDLNDLRLIHLSGRRCNDETIADPPPWRIRECDTAGACRHVCGQARPRRSNLATVERHRPALHGEHLIAKVCQCRRWRSRRGAGERDDGPACERCGCRADLQTPTIDDDVACGDGDVGIGGHERTLGEAYASLGQVLKKVHRDAESLAAHERGVALSPAYATGHQWYSYGLGSNGRWDESIREMETAHKLDPLAHVITLSLAIAYDGAERFADASPLYAQGLAQQPQAWYAWRFRFWHELALKRYDEAAAALLMALEDPASDSYEELARLAPRWINPGTRAAATDSLIATGPVFAALALARWTRSDSVAVAVMERAVRDPRQVDARSSFAMYALLGPRLRADPRLKPSFRALGFPSSAKSP